MGEGERRDKLELYTSLARFRLNFRISLNHHHTNRKFLKGSKQRRRLRGAITNSPFLEYQKFLKKADQGTIVLRHLFSRRLLSKGQFSKQTFVQDGFGPRSKFDKMKAATGP